MTAGHEQATFEGISDLQNRALMLVTGINLMMFVVEMGAGPVAGSQSLQADALDFLAAGITYALSFWAVGRPERQRSGASVLRALVLLVMGLWIGLTTLYQFFVHGMPVPEMMGGVGLLALVANGVSVWLLLAYKDAGPRLRSVWLRSRNNAIGNAAVLIAAGLVVVLGNGAPDLIVAGVMVALFLGSSSQILTQSWRAWQHGAGSP